MPLGPALRRYVAAVAVLGAGALAAWLAAAPAPSSLLAASLLAALAALAGLFPLPLAPGRKFSVASAVEAAALLLLAPAAALVAVGTGALVANLALWRAGRRDGWNTLFNTGQLLLALGLAAAVLARGLPAGLPALSAFDGRTATTLAAAAAALYLANTLAVAGAIRLQRGGRLLALWWAAVRLDALPTLTLYLVGLAAALAARPHSRGLGSGVVVVAEDPWAALAVAIERHPWALAALALPVLLVYQSLRRTAALLERERTARAEAEAARAEAEAARAEAEAAGRRLALLAAASETFAAAELDLAATLDAVARRVAEGLGDGCVLHLLSADGRRLEQAAGAHRDPAAAAAMRETVPAAEPADAGPQGRVLRTGEPLLLPPAARSLGSASLLIVPLRQGDRTLGTLSVGRAAAGQPYRAEDRDLLQALADRAALAIANARLYRRAEDALALRDQFLSIASHELKTPVANVAGYAQLLEEARARGRLDEARLARYLGTLRTSAEHLARLTRDLLEVSRLRTGKLAVQPRPLDLAAAVRESVARCRARLDDPHRLATEGLDAALPAMADPARIEQVVTNLLENALKYSPQGGEIRLVLAATGDGALLSVRDTGIGLPTGATAAIFAPFGRAANAERLNLPGLGLGLFICRLVAEAHGGRIWAESAGEGRGTTVSLWLPSAVASGAAAATPAVTEAAIPVGEGRG